MTTLEEKHDRSYYSSMKSKSVQTYDRVMDRGLDILSVTGLSGVTIGVLAEAAGLSKSGLFAHFRSKEDIQIKLLQHAEAIVVARVVAPAMTAEPGLPRLDAFMKAWLGWSRRAGLSGGCPLASAMFELDDLRGDVRAHLLEAEARSQRALADLVREAMDQGALSADADIEQIVWELRGIYLSHHVSSRLIDDPECDRRAWRAYKTLIDRADS